MHEQEYRPLRDKKETSQTHSGSQERDLQDDVSTPRAEEFRNSTTTDSETDSEIEAEVEP